MARVQEFVSLRSHNTFGLDVKSRWWLDIHSEKEALEALMDNLNAGRRLMVLGGGSNVLFVEDFPGLMLHNRILGKEVVRENEESIWLRVGAGENWHELVLYTLAHNWSGLQNLSLIPGSVGAAPIQNIGAYGVEIKEVFESLDAINLQTGQQRSFTNAACQFGYRDSIFKRHAKGKYFITHVTLRLSKQPVLNTQYGAIEKELAQMGAEPSIHSISEAVIRIRQSKLPDPKEIGNSGSFFKNPVISAEAFASIQTQYPNVPHYPADEGFIKVPAGWLIEQCGWKGLRRENYGVHARQALVLVNYGGASGRQIYDLSSEILTSVQEKFGVALEREVNIIGE